MSQPHEDDPQRRDEDARPPRRGAARDQGRGSRPAQTGDRRGSAAARSASGRYDGSRGGHRSRGGDEGRPGAGQRRPAAGAEARRGRDGQAPRRDGQPTRDGAPGRGGSGHGRERPGSSGRPQARRDDDRTGRGDRAERPDRPPEPHIPDEVEPQMLDRAARTRLRTLGKNNAELVARHLVMAGRLIDEEPGLAYEHAQAAMRRAGRVDVVREAVALTAYATGAYAEALRELRTTRRLSGIDAHRPVEADCERGLGRPERALAIVNETNLAQLSEEDRAELAIVASGARADLGEHEAGLMVLESAMVAPVREPELLRRIALVRADRLNELGRTGEAEALLASVGGDDGPDIVLDDLDPDADERPDEPGQSR